MSYLDVIIPSSHRLGVLCFTSLLLFHPITGWMCYVLLKCYHSIQSQVGGVMFYFPVIVPSNRRLDVWRLTSCSEFIHTEDYFHITLTFKIERP